MALDLKKGWKKVKGWWQSETCFVKNPYFWLMTGGTIAAAVLTGGFLLPLLAVIPFYAVAAEKDLLKWGVAKNWMKKKLGYTGVSIIDNELDAHQAMPITEKERKALVFHTQNFKEGVLFLHWIKNAFIHLAETEELDTEKNELVAFFEEWDVNSNSSLKAEASLLETHLTAYEEKRVNQTDKEQRITQATFKEKMNANLSFSGKVLRPFAKDNVKQSANPMPESINAFGKRIPQTKIAALTYLVYRVFRSLFLLKNKELVLNWDAEPSQEAYGVFNPDGTVSQKAQDDFWADTAKIDAEIAEYERQSAIAQEKSAIAREKSAIAREKSAIAREKSAIALKASEALQKEMDETDRYIRRIDRSIFKGMKKLVEDAMKSEPYDFSILKHRLTLNKGVLKEEMIAMLEKGCFTDAELSALRAEQILDMLAEYERQSAIAREKSGIALTASEALQKEMDEIDRDIRRIDRSIFKGMKKLVEDVMKSEPYDFSILKHRLTLNGGVLKEEMTEMLEKGCFTDAELSALRAEQILDMLEEPIKRESLNSYTDSEGGSAESLHSRQTEVSITQVSIFKHDFPKNRAASPVLKQENDATLLVFSSKPW